MKTFVALCVVVAATAVTALRMQARHASESDEPMQFALRFRTESINGVNHGVASSQSLVSLVDGSRVAFDVMEGQGREVRWTSVLVAQQGDLWSEKGNVTFDAQPDDVLHFESPGLAGHALNSNWGGIVYNITGGAGRFAGSVGVMVDTFWNPPTNATNASAFWINAWAMIWVKSP